MNDAFPEKKLQGRRKPSPPTGQRGLLPGMRMLPGMLSCERAFVPEREGRKQ
jgi:hypothetical protein